VRSRIFAQQKKNASWPSQQPLPFVALIRLLVGQSRDPAASSDPMHGMAPRSKPPSSSDSTRSAGGPAASLLVEVQNADAVPNLDSGVSNWTSCPRGQARAETRALAVTGESAPNQRGMRRGSFEPHVRIAVSTAQNRRNGADQRRASRPQQLRQPDTCSHSARTNASASPRKKKFV